MNGRQVRLTILGDEETPLSARLEDVSGRSALLRIPRRVPLNVAVRVDLDDALLLGEICYCSPINEDFRIGLVIDQTLTGIEDILALSRALMDEQGQSGQREHTDAMHQRSNQRQ